jgi:GNAT superfamily N-acetyltransferase
MNFDSSLVIADASKEDISGILSIQSQRIIFPEGKNASFVAAGSGFLVYPVSRDDLVGIIEGDRNIFVKVAKERDRVIGYLLSYDMREWTKKRREWFKKFNPFFTMPKFLFRKELILYGRHIAVDKKFVRFGIGERILNSVLRDAERNGYKYFLVEVMREPVQNLASANFVERMGFNLIGDMHDRRHRFWNVFSKDLKRSLECVGRR